MKKLQLLLILILFQISVFGQLNPESQKVLDTFRQLEMQNWNEARLQTAQHRGDSTIDVKFYHLDIEIAIDSAYISGSVLCRFTPTVNNLDQITLDLNRALTVSNVSEAGTSFSQNGDSLIINLDDNYNPGDLIDIRINYEGIPVMAGGYKGLRYETHGNEEPIIATLSTPYLAHYWYPCKDGPDDKADSVYIDVSIHDETVNGIEMIAISNGILESTSISGNKKTFSWRHRYPIVTYYVMVAISNYKQFEDQFVNNSGDTIPLIYYAFNEVLQAQQEGVEDMPEAIGFFSEKYGDYPFTEEKYGMTQLGYYGAIENQTNTIINSMDKNWFMTSVHELAHMWFGDMITCETWNHAWLNEGFATYSEALWIENQSGESVYKSYMNNLQYFGDGTIYLENSQDTFNIFTAIIYYKGAWALHMLRNVVGDELFFQSINNYASDTNFMYKTTITEDFQEVVETTCEMDLDYFFEEWIYGEYYPYYYYNFLQNENGKLFVSLYQKQQEIYEDAFPVFTMPVELSIHFNDQTDSTVTVWNDEQLQEFEFNFPDKEVIQVYVDENRKILRKQSYNPDIPVGINQSSANDKILVYPNPFNNSLSVYINKPLSTPYHIKVFDIAGKQIMEGQILNKTTSLNTEELPAGIYLYTISNNMNPVKSGKIFKR